jgi:hypothetical protein
MEKVKMSTEPFHVTDTNFEETLKNNKLFFVISGLPGVDHAEL